MLKIIGYGNPFRRDDAIGIWIAARLKYIWAPPQDKIDFWIGQQLVPELAEWIYDADAALFIDSSLKLKNNRGWDLIEVLPRDEFTHNMFHSIDVGTILSLCKEEYGMLPRTYLLAITGYDFSYGAGLTKEAKKAAEEAIEYIKDFIAKGLFYKSY